MKRILHTGKLNLIYTSNFYYKAYIIFNRDFGGSFLLPLLKTINYDNNSVPIVFSSNFFNIISF